jgi:hypothetical protein
MHSIGQRTGDHLAMPTPTGLDSQVVHVTVGVDTHVDVHVAAALDQLGRLLGTHSTATTPAGSRTRWGHYDHQRLRRTDTPLHSQRHSLLV